MVILMVNGIDKDNGTNMMVIIHSMVMVYFLALATLMVMPIPGNGKIAFMIR